MAQLAAELKSTSAKLARVERTKAQLQMGLPVDEPIPEANSQSAATDAELAKAKSMLSKMSKQLAAAKKKLKEQQKETNRYKVGYCVVFHSFDTFVLSNNAYCVSKFLHEKERQLNGSSPMASPEKENSNVQ